MTNDPNRLDRIEAIVESNSRAIQAMLDAQVEDRLRHQEWMQETQRRIEQNERGIQRLDETIRRLTNIQAGTNRLLASLDDDRPTVLRRLSSIENKIDILLERNAEDRLT